MTDENIHNRTEWPRWLHDAYNLERNVPGALFPTLGIPGKLIINTLEGALIVCIDDWIIKGVKGEIYPCKPDIFEATYEPEEGTRNCTLDKELARIFR